MTKKKKEVLVEEPIQVKVKQPKTPSWEIKDRQYYLKKDGSPLTYVLQSKSSRKNHYYGGMKTKVRTEKYVTLVIKNHLLLTSKIKM